MVSSPPRHLNFHRSLIGFCGFVCSDRNLIIFASMYVQDVIEEKMMQAWVRTVLEIFSMLLCN